MATIKSIEDRAKRYDEALERAKKLYEQGTITESLSYVFPELKESEDERIVDAIKKALESKIEDLGNGVTKTACIAWLEKQGEQKPAFDIDIPFGAKDSELMEASYYIPEGFHAEIEGNHVVIKKGEQKSQGKLEDDVRRRSTIQVLEYARSLDTYNQYGKTDIDKNISWLEKQGEKPQGKTALEAINEEKVDNANKVEPKFKVGDWISGYYTNYKVLSVNNDGYLVENVDGNKINILFENEKFHHLWTIQDAKDGDVLVDTEGSVFIFRKICDDYPNVYGGINTENNFEHGYDSGFWTNKPCFPATKEQRDLLFQKMKEAGYEWDKEKKQLKKKKVIHKELTEFERAVKQVMEEAIECGDTHNLKADADMLLSLVQKPAWSDEDETNLRRTEYAVMKFFGGDCSLVGWLRKSLKDRYTWKPSDEQMKAQKRE